MAVRDGETIRQILLALYSIAGDFDTDKTPPTKQGGLGRDALKQPKRRG